jgi:hypothetical protein
LIWLLFALRVELSRWKLFALERVVNVMDKFTCGFLGIHKKRFAFPKIDGSKNSADEAKFSLHTLSSRTLRHIAFRAGLYYKYHISPLSI